MSGSDPTVPMGPGPRRPADGPPSGGFLPQGGGYQGPPPPGEVPAPGGYAPYPPVRRTGAGFVGVAFVGALVAGVVAAAGTYVATVEHPDNPFLHAIGLSTWPWYGYNDVSKIYTLFGIDLAGVVVVTFLLLLVVTRPSPGGRSWLTVFFGTWSVVTVAAVIAHLVAVEVSGVDLGRWKEFQIVEIGAMWGFLCGWLPAAFAATANAMRRG